jgi:NSS family neurotransmitter:Na+ symporter
MKTRDKFSSLGFVVAAAGSAIGLGNIWKFPYITYANDGGSFVLIYLIAIALIGLPIMLAEILMGRRSQQSPVTAFLHFSKDVAGGKLWSGVGFLGVAAGLVILSYYSVVAGWTVYYFGKCVQWSVSGFNETLAGSLDTEFGSFLGNGPLQILFHAIFMSLTVGVVISGIKGGIERVTKLLLPILMIILGLLCVAAMFTPGFGEAIRFLFHVGPIHTEAVLEAVGHSFFTLSLGMGALITYGSYLGRKQSIPRDALMICVLDTVIALMACVVMFSIIFSVPEAERATTFTKSATILFTTLPRMFYSLPGGVIIAPVFYLLVAFAALTSTISLLEVVASFLIDKLGWSRRKAALVSGGTIFATGVLAALSLGANQALSNWAPFGERDQGVFGVLDYFASNWMLPVGGLLTAIFVGWFLESKLTRDELEEGHGLFKVYGLWRFLLRYVCPLAIGWIILAVVGGRAFN